jgi:hypothetical protein
MDQLLPVLTGSVGSIAPCHKKLSPERTLANVSQDQKAARPVTATEQEAQKPAFGRQRSPHPALLKPIGTRCRSA